MVRTERIVVAERQLQCFLVVRRKRTIRIYQSFQTPLCFGVLPVEFNIFIDMLKMGSFWVTLCLGFKTSLSAKHFTWKWVWFAWKWTCGGIYFHTNGLARKLVNPADNYNWFGLTTLIKKNRPGRALTSCIALVAIIDASLIGNCGIDHVL